MRTISYTDKNVNLIRRSSHQLINHVFEKEPIDDYIIEEIADINNYIIQNKSGRCYLHSLYNIQREVQKTFEGADRRVEVLVAVGVGLGHSINYIKKTFFNLKHLILIEPNPDVFKAMLSKNDLQLLMKGIPEVTFIVNQNAEEAAQLLFNKMEGRFNQQFEVVVHLPYKTLYGGYYEKVHELFLSNARRSVVDLATKDRFSHLWVLNTFRNISIEHHASKYLYQLFHKKSVILVSAGPSLNKNMHLINKLKESAIVVAVGSAIKILDSNGIIPHFRMAVDGLRGEKKIFDDLHQKNVPLIFSDMLYYEILENYEGPKYKIVLSSDYLTQYVEKHKEQECHTVPSGFSVANIALNFFCLCQASSIIFMGQDLAYTKGSMYAKGSWKKEGTLDLESSKYIKTIDMLGNEVFTDRVYIGIKSIIEKSIESYKGNIEFIDGTEGGLLIKGTRTVKLQEFIEKELNKSEKLENTNIETLDSQWGSEYNQILKAMKKIKHENRRVQEVITGIVKSLSDIHKNGFVDYESDELAQIIETNEMNFNKMMKSEFCSFVISRYAYDYFKIIDYKHIKKDDQEIKQQLKTRFERLASYVSEVKILADVFSMLFEEFESGEKINVIFE